MALGLLDTKKRAPTQRLKANGEPVERKTLAEVALPHNTSAPGTSVHDAIQTPQTAPQTVDVVAPTSYIPDFNFEAFKASEIQKTEPDNNPTKEISEPDKKPDKENKPTRQQPDKDLSPLSGSTQFKHTLKVEPDNNPIITRQETRQKTRQQPDKENDSSESLEDTILSLPENPKRAFSYICDSLLNNGGDYLLTSYKIISKDTEIPDGSIRGVIKNQLRGTFGLINLEADGGGPQAKIKIFVAGEALRVFIKIQHRISKTRQQPDKEPDKKPDKNASSKLVNIINNNILTNDDEDPYAGYEDIETSSLYPFGVYSKQVMDVRNQLRKASIIFTASQMQGVVDRFVKYCSKPNNIANIKNKQAFFCSAAVSIAKGESDPFGEVLSSGDEALLLINKRRQEEMALKIRIDEMISKTEFEHWKFDLTGIERKQILGNLDSMSLSADTLDAQLYHHFYNFVWPDFRPTFKTQINEQIRAADLQKKSEQEQALLEKAQTYLKDPKWVNQAAMSHNLLSIQDSGERQRKLESLAKDLAGQKGL
jgi:hypothetical protein